LDKNNRKRQPILTNRHNLLQWEQPVIFLRRVLRVYPQEVKLLVWVTLIQLVMRVSSVLVNNFAQTAFLKRFGVEHLPTIFMIEAVLTFFFASYVGLLMDRFKTLRVFSGLLIFFALSAGLIRGLLPYNILLIYPILYILKSQAIEILPILYWDILSDIFTTQQSKRLYTLITAGGVLGATLGSLLTGPVARWVGVDNVLLIFVGGLTLAAVLNEFTEKIVGAPIEPRTGRRRNKGGEFRENLKAFVASAKKSSLLKYMILIIAIPNMVLPVLDYQFNVAVDAYFATEGKTLYFFGLYRGISNAVMFGILMFSGRIVTRWGVATSLIFHPINYLIAFGALFLRFDIFSGIYARFSTETLKTTINNPARAVLYNFFPPDMRGLIRVFLRGSIVRASDFAGSGLLILVKGLMAPRFLSLLAAPLVLIWIWTSTRIKKRYSSMVIESLTAGQIDWRHLEDVDFQAWLKDKGTIQRLQQGLKDKDPHISATCGEMLSKMAPAGWAEWIVKALPGKSATTQKALLDLLDRGDAGEALPVMLQMTGDASPETLAVLLPALSRLGPKESLSAMEAFLDHPALRVRSEALAGLFLSGEDHARNQFRKQIQQLLGGDQTGMRMAVEILGKTGDPFFAPVLLQWAESQDTDLKSRSLRGLGKMKHDKALDIALKAIDEPNSQVRTAALEVMADRGEKTPTDFWIRLLGDGDPNIREKASLAIIQGGKGAVQDLLTGLTLPSRIVRNEVLSILTQLGAPSVMLSEFIMSELEKAYHILEHVKVLNDNEGDRTTSLLKEHLMERNIEIQELVLRLLGILEFGDHMKVILKAIQSRNKRDMDNAIEALEASLHPDIRKILIPLLEERSLEEKILIGRERLKTAPPPDMRLESCLMGLLADDDPITRALSIYGLGEINGNDGPCKEAIQRCLGDENRMVREAALRSSHEPSADISPEAYPFENVSLIDKALCVRKIPIFMDLRVQEIMAIAYETKVRSLAEGDILVREGDPGDSLYLIMDGELAVIKGIETNRAIILGRMGKDQFLGDMALIDHQPRSATIRADSDSLLLVLEAVGFERLMRDFYTIPLNICKVLSQRIRALHERLQNFENTPL